MEQEIHKSYADKERTIKKFKVGDAHLKVKPKESCLKLRICPNMGTQFCGAFEILYRIGPASYAFVFPTFLCVHNVFHVSLLNKYVIDPNHIIDWNMI